MLILKHISFKIPKVLATVVFSILMLGIASDALLPLYADYVDISSVEFLEKSEKETEKEKENKSEKTTDKLTSEILDSEFHLDTNTISIIYFLVNWKNRSIEPPLDPPKKA